ncbi:MAG: hypothetical protein VKK97_10390 [Synechococcaceae cyanobacterium]|nr:hypothetical protein [Synechococcaceae cyanobacterium]
MRALVAAALLLSGAPVVAATNEMTWRRVIAEMIRGGAPAEDICIKARSVAAVSDAPKFVAYALDIARKYCPPGEIGEKKPDPNQIKPTRVNGHMVGVCSHGSLCQGQLERAIKGPPRPGW